MAREGTLFILVGPSGAGKNTLMTRVQARLGENGLPQLATYTTRGPREGECEGVQHHFVTDERFNELVAQEGFFIEYQNVHAKHFYGTPRGPVERAFNERRDLIADIDFLGAAAVRRAYPANTVIIFLTPSSLDILAERIRQRGGSAAENLAGRLARARFELTYVPQCDYLVVNDELETAVDDLYRIVQGERQRRGGDGEAAPITRHAFHAQVAAVVERDSRVLASAGERCGHLPTFAHDIRDQRPDETLSVRLADALAVPVELESSNDERLKFPPPRHVTLEGASSAFTLHYYYRCFVPADADVPEEWAWQPVEQLALAEDVRAHIWG